MKKTLIATAIVATLSCAAAFAQSTPPAQPSPSTSPTPQMQPLPAQQPEQQQPATPPQAAPPASANAAVPAGAMKIAPGSVIPVELTKTVDAKKAKTGDQVVAKVTEDLKTNSGDLLLPKNTKVVGHVTEVQAHTKEQKESQLGIAFDHAVMKNGDMQMPMSIQAVIGAPSSNASGNNDQAPSGAPTSAGASPMGGSSNGAAGGSTQPQSRPSPSMSAPNSDSNEKSAGGRPPITGNTQGVIGISDMKLEAGQNAAQGSVMTSDKNNVKLESGTMMLLRVQQ